MEEKEIKKIFEKLGINVIKISSATNSFNSNVYIISDNEKIYVTKEFHRKYKRWFFSH